jgi:predicted RNase H-like nuclease (RuvC/YqgF family)
MATKKETKVIEEGQQVLFVQQEQVVNPLEQTVLELQNKIVELQNNIIDLSKTRDNLTQQIFDNDKIKIKIQQEHELVISTMKKEAESKATQTEILSSKFNELAKLFDDYIKSFDDTIELQKVFLRNNLRSQELLQVKIKAFNGEGENK